MGIWIMNLEKRESLTFHRGEHDCLLRKNHYLALDVIFSDTVTERYF